MCIELLTVSVGVPTSAPVELMLKPEGREGVTLHEVTAPPVNVGRLGVIAVLLVKTNELFPYESVLGGSASTVMVT